jgi:hypothetical protein
VRRAPGLLKITIGIPKMKLPFTIEYDPIFGVRYKFHANFNKFPNCKWASFSESYTKCSNPSISYDSWNIADCENCPLFEKKPYLDIERLVRQSSFVKKCLPSLIIFLLILFFLIRFVISYDIIPSRSYSLKFIGILVSITGVLLSSNELLIYMRKILKKIMSKIEIRIKQSLIWEYLVFPSEGLKVIFHLLGFFIVIILISLFFGDLQPLLFVLAEKYNFIQYIGPLAILVIIVWLGSYWFSTGSEKLLYLIIYSIVFIPRLIFWSIMWFSSNMYRATGRYSTSRIIGGLLSIIGVIILASI